MYRTPTDNAAAALWVVDWSPVCTQYPVAILDGLRSLVLGKARGLRRG